MNWYLKALSKYAVFEGRASRKEYWMFILFNMLISFAIGIVSGISMFTSSMVGMGTGIEAVQIVNLLYSLAVMIPSWAVGVRRMHDIGRSGWWMLFPVVNLVFFCLDGDPYENEYGSDPKDEYLAP